MNSEASDDLLTRVRVYLSGLEPDGIPADDLTDDEVAGLVMETLGRTDDRLLWLLTPERMRPRVSIGLRPALAFVTQQDIEQAELTRGVIDRIMSENLTVRLTGGNFAEGLEFGAAELYNNLHAARRADYENNVAPSMARLAGGSYFLQALADAAPRIVEILMQDDPPTPTA
jgi:hypothetical protein